ncbi:MAG TPA: S9 family peptidase, partial [Candidatus Dormibacteraeota bacterium]|nr:S9 family peptidase [Candidatus Dormibacteraeota bacterium]
MAVETRTMSVPLRRTSLVTVLLARTCATQAAPPSARTPITHEKLWMMKRVGAPQVSPDGKWVAFSVLEPAYDQDKEVSDLWLVPADGSAPPRRLTHTKA